MDQLARPKEPACGTSTCAIAERSARMWRAAAPCSVVSAVIVVVWSAFSAHRAAAKLEDATEAQAVVTVATTKPQSQTESTELILPGNVQANYDAPIYARTSGYLKRWLVDIGTPVKAGSCSARSTRRKSTSSCARRRRISRRTGQPEDRERHGRSLARSAQHGFGVEAGGRREDQPRAPRAMPRCRRPGERAAAARAVGLREDRCAVRWRGHGAQHRHRPADHGGRQHRAGVVPGRGHAPPAPVRARAADLCGGDEAGSRRRNCSSRTARARSTRRQLDSTSSAIDQAITHAAGAAQSSTTRTASCCRARTRKCTSSCRRRGRARLQAAGERVAVPRRWPAGRHRRCDRPCGVEARDGRARLWLRHRDRSRPDRRRQRDPQSAGLA